MGVIQVAAGESTKLDIPALSGFENAALWVILAVSLVALFYAFMLVRGVLAKDEGTDTMKAISLAIREGANAYLLRVRRSMVS